MTNIKYFVCFIALFALTNADSVEDNLIENAPNDAEVTEKEGPLTVSFFMSDLA